MHVGVCLSTVGLMTTRLLLGRVIARSIRILLECFLVLVGINRAGVQCVE